VLAEALCRANNFELMLGRTLMARSRVMINTGEYKAMISLLTEASRIFEKLGDVRRQAYARGNLANAYISLGETDNAFQMYKLVSEMMTSLNDTVGSADCLLNIGLIYEDEKGKEETALKYLDDAIKMYSGVADQEQGIAIAYNTKGNIMRRMGNFVDAIGFYLIAVQSARVVNDKYVVVDIYNALADTYIEHKEYANALKRIDDGLKMCEEIGYTRGAMDLKASRANLHTQQKEYDEAIALFESILAEAQKASIKMMMLNCYQGLEQAYHKRHNPKKARTYNHLANQLAEELKLHPEMENEEAQ